MAARPSVPEAATAKRCGLDRWWLLLANLLVANAASLHVGPGGLRSPSSAVNLWIAALVLMAPLLRRSLRNIRRPGMSVATKVWIVTMRVLGTAVAACLASLVLGPVALVAMGVLWIPAPPSFGLWCLVGIIAVLLVDALLRWPRASPLGGVFRAVRAVACVPPYGMLAMVLLFVPVGAPAWVGGMDTMFVPVARIDDGTHGYVAVRSDPMAFTDPALRVLLTTPLVPSVLGWWRQLGRLPRVATADLRLDGDELCVDYHSYPAAESAPVLHRRFRIR